MKLPRNPVVIAAIGGIFLVAAIVLVLYVNSDSTADREADPASAGKASTGTPPTASETVTGSESRSPTTSVGTRLALPVPAAMNGFITIDPVKDNVTPIWLGTDRMWDYPRLTAGRDAIWLSWDNGTEESVRFDLTGNEVDRVPGASPDESRDGKIVSFCTTH